MATIETKLDYARRKLNESESKLKHFPNWRTGQFYQERVEVYDEMVRDLERSKNDQMDLILSAKVALAELSNKYTITREIGNEDEINEARIEYETCNSMYSEMVRKYREEWGSEQTTKDFTERATTTHEV